MLKISNLTNWVHNTLNRTIHSNHACIFLPSLPHRLILKGFWSLNCPYHACLPLAFPYIPNFTPPLMSHFDLFPAVLPHDQHTLISPYGTYCLHYFLKCIPSSNRILTTVLQDFQWLSHFNKNLISKLFISNPKLDLSLSLYLLSNYN